MASPTNASFSNPVFDDENSRRYRRMSESSTASGPEKSERYHSDISSRQLCVEYAIVIIVAVLVSAGISLILLFLLGPTIYEVDTYSAATAAPSTNGLFTLILLAQLVLHY